MSPTDLPTQPTFWYHPESDCYWIYNPKPSDGPLDDGHSIELTEQEYITKLVDHIEKDPEHKLPEGITAIIKRAAEWPEGSISGLIYYDKHERFVDGYPINLSKTIEKLPGGIYKTANNTYLVELVQPFKPEGPRG